MIEREAEPGCAAWYARWRPHVLKYASRCSRKLNKLCTWFWYGETRGQKKHKQKMEALRRERARKHSRSRTASFVKGSGANGARGAGGGGRAAAQPPRGSGGVAASTALH